MVGGHPFPAQLLTGMIGEAAGAGMNFEEGVDFEGE
jgi:hypothetical protein